MGSKALLDHFLSQLPHLVVGLPLHPPLEHLPGAGDVADHLLHVNVLVPQLNAKWGPVPRSGPAMRKHGARSSLR